MRLITPLVLALALVGAGTRCGFPSEGSNPGSDPVPDPAATTRILFVGNSLTYFNDLPGMVAALADSAGIDGVQTAQWDPLESTCRHASLSIL